MSSEPRVELERRAKRQSVSGNRTIRADEKGQRPQEPRRDARQSPPLANGFTRAPEVTGSQRAQAAMRGLLMIERRAAAEVRRLDECRPEAAAGSFIRTRQPVNATADHQHVVGGALESRQVA